MDRCKLFVLVFARDKEHIPEKITELEGLGLPYIIICGNRFDHPNVVYRPAIGKYDAINFGLSLVPKETDTVVLNDVDTKIYNFEAAMKHLKGNTALVFARDVVNIGPQVLFHQLLFSILKIIPVIANGDLMFIRRDVMERITLRPCKAEDAYILFKTLELGYGASFCEECYVETEKTTNEKEEERYKRRTVAGIYQALSYTRPPIPVRLFYVLLPFLSPLLLVLGERGYYWVKGIFLGLSDYIVGDRSGFWSPSN